MLQITFATGFEVRREFLLHIQGKNSGSISRTLMTLPQEVLGYLH